MNADEQILTSLLNCRRMDLYAERRSLTDEQERAFLTMRDRFRAGEPLQYVIGHCDFMGLALQVNRGVLIPRPETEILVEKAVAEAKSCRDRSAFRILDLGTGSGNIAISLAKFIEDCKIVAVDISWEALEFARKNSRKHEVEERIEFLHADMKDLLEGDVLRRGAFDMIISNPPYIPSENLGGLPRDVQHEPRTALDGGGDGLDFYRLIIQKTHELLKKNGMILMEIGDGQRAGIERLFSQNPCFGHVVFIKDYVGTDRIVSAQKIGG